MTCSHWRSGWIFFTHYFYSFSLIAIDSGLSLTTVRDVTEIESDRESKLNGSVVLRNSKLHRSMPMKRNNNDTDSDDVFGEVETLGISFRPRLLCFVIVECFRSQQFQTVVSATISKTDIG